MPFVNLVHESLGKESGSQPRSNNPNQAMRFAYPETAQMVFTGTVVGDGINPSIACFKLRRTGAVRVLFYAQLFWVLLLCCLDGLFAQETVIPVIDAEAQEKVVHLLQRVIQDNWEGSESKATTNVIASYTNVETAFRQASKLMPNRLDLRFGIASSLIAQAAQTNGQQLELKLKEALGVYQEIQTLDTNSFEAPILYAAYTRAMGNTNSSEATIARLVAIHPERTASYVDKFNLIERIFQSAPNLKPSRTMPKNNQHAIVILGAGLETNGTMKAKLISRLEQGLKLARIYPKSPLILTGGNQKSGVTEAYVMSLWYLKRGFSRKRLFLEDQARDTVENAVFSSAILQRLRVTHVTLVTSTSHIHRGLALLEEACLQRGLHLQYEQLASKTKGDNDLDKEQQRLGVYRDVMRVSGIWSFPGLRR